MNNQGQAKVLTWFFSVSRLLLLMAVLPVPSLDAQSSVESQIPPEAVAFKPTVRSYAFDPQTGVLAATALSERHLSLFDAKNFEAGVHPEPRHIPVNAEPVCVICRQLDNRPVFVVSMSAPPSLLLMETNGTLLKRYRLQSTPSKLFHSADPNDPYIYWQSRGLVKFDLQKMIITGEPALDTPLLNISADGTAVYEATSGDVKDFMKRNVDASLLYRNDAKKVPATGPVYITDPQTGAVASGETIYSADLSTVIANYKFAPQQAFPDRSLIAGFREHYLCVGSTNTNATVTEFAIPESWFKSTKPFGHRDTANPPRVFVDSSRGRVIVATAYGVMAVQLSDLKIPTEPVLRLSSPLPASVTFGESLDFELPFITPGPKVVKLKEAPEGMTIMGNKIRWTPTTQQVGDHQLELLVTADSFTTAMKWHVSVRLPAFTLPLKPSGMSVSEDESQAIVWGNAERPGLSLKLVIIDLHSGAILEHDCKDNPIVSALIDGTNLYVLRRSTFEKLAIPQFNVVASIPLDKNEILRPDQINLVPPKRLMLGERRFDLPDLTESAKFLHDIHQLDEWLTGATAFGKMIDGVLWKDDSTSPRMLIWPAMLYRFPARDNIWRTEGGKEIVVTADTWFPCLPVAKFSPVYGIQRQRTKGGISCPFTFELNEVRDTHDVEIIPRSQLTGEQEEPFPLLIKNRPNERLSLTCGRERFYLLRGSQLISGSLSQWTSRPKPFHIEPNQTEFFLNAETPVRVKYFAEGGTNYKIEMLLRGETKAAKFESQTGEFDLLVPKDHQKLIDWQASTIYNIYQAEAKCDVRLKEFSKPIDSWYQEMFGRSANGKLPIPVTVLVTAQNLQQGSFTFLHSYIFEVSSAKILEAMQRMYPKAK